MGNCRDELEATGRTGQFDLANCAQILVCRVFVG